MSVGLERVNAVLSQEIFPTPQRPPNICPSSSPKQTSFDVASQLYCETHPNICRGRLWRGRRLLWIVRCCFSTFTFVPLDSFPFLTLYRPSCNSAATKCPGCSEWEIICGCREVDVGWQPCCYTQTAADSVLLSSCLFWSGSHVATPSQLLSQRCLLLCDGHVATPKQLLTQCYLLWCDGHLATPRQLLIPRFQLLGRTQLYPPMSWTTHSAHDW